MSQAALPGLSKRLGCLTHHGGAQRIPGTFDAAPTVVKRGAGARSEKTGASSRGHAPEGVHGRRGSSFDY